MELAVAWYSSTPWWAIACAYLFIIGGAYEAPWKTSGAILAFAFLAMPVMASLNGSLGGIELHEFWALGFGVILAVFPPFAIGFVLRRLEKGADERKAEKQAQAAKQRERREQVRRERQKIADFIGILDTRILQLQQQAEDEAYERERNARRARQKLDDHMLTLRSALRALKQSPQDSMMLNTMDETLAQMVAEEDQLADYLLEPELQQDLHIIRGELDKAGIDDPFLTGRLERLTI